MKRITVCLVAVLLVVALSFNAIATEGDELRIEPIESTMDDIIKSPNELLSDNIYLMIDEPGTVGEYPSIIEDHINPDVKEELKINRITAESVKNNAYTSGDFYMSGNDSVTMLAGSKLKIIVENKKVKSYKSNNKKVVTVSDKGLVTTKGKGKAKITITLTNKKKLTLTITVKRNIIDNISSKPSVDRINWGQEIYLKSLEIISPSKVVAEYWLVFKHISAYKTKKFTYIDATIYADDKLVVDGKVKNIKISTRGMTVKKFKITFTGTAVKNTNVNLNKLNGYDIAESNDFWLTWKY